MDVELSQKPHDRLLSALSAEMEAVTEVIRARMASEHAPRIPEVSAHLVEAGGKRLRPLLTLATAAMCGYEGEDHIKLAATVEFIHTATLLHDDVVDESGQRRGRPTANLLWDNKSSVLVGDYLFARSFQLMVETGSLKVLDILSNAAATIAEGEVLQLTASQNLSTNEEIYLKIVRGKTAALFSAATQVGGVISNVPAEHEQALFDYGDALGISFQIVDDLLDYDGDTSKTGKNIGDDFRERKLTLPVIYAVDAARGAESDQELTFWRRTIERGDQRPGDLEEALRLITVHRTLEKTRAQAVAWRDRSKSALASLPQAEIGDMLMDLADYVVERVT
ncbi:MAG: polyprenyl synthetase family protein [Pseudomonadota bacterium]